MNTKGQLTVFIILGLFILLVAGVGIYFYSKTTATVSKELPTLASVPKEAEPVSSYVTACLEKTLGEGLKYIGSRGGFYDTSSLNYNFLSPTTQGTNAVQFSRDSKIIIPYWHYMSSDDKCDEAGKCELTQSIPTRESIKTNIEKYVEKNIKKCLGEFEDFEEKGISIQESSTPKATVYIQQSTVAVLLDYKIKTSSQGVKINLDRFTSKINVNLNEILTLSSTITLAEEKYSFLENLAKELVGIYSGLDKQSLPGSGVTLNSGTVYWFKSEVADKISRMLVANIPLLQTGGTENYQYIKSPPQTKDPKLFETLYNRDFYIPLEQLNVGKDYSAFEVKFIYLPDWKLYFDLNCEGELCRPDPLFNFLFFLNIQKYNFAYDMSFPVMVEINQKNAFDNEGYVFRFMLEANIRANEPVKEINTPTKIAETSSGGDFCNPEKFSSGKIKLNVIDGETKKPVDKAQVSFNCINQGCLIGETTNGVLESKFPYCLGGTLSVMRDDYDAAYVSLDPNKNSQSINIEINPFKEIEVKAKKILIKKTPAGWIIDETPADIDADEHTTIMIKKKTKPLEQDYMTATKVYGDPSKKSDTLRLSPGTYEVTINSVLSPNKNEAIIFPPQEKCIKKKAVGVTYGKECFNIPQEPMKFYYELGEDNSLPNGKASLTWTITPEMFKGAKTAEFKFLSIDIRGVPERNRYIQDFEQINKLDKYIKNSKDLLEPEMKTQ